MPKILYLITEDWFFVSHFLPIARAARDLGFEVVVAARAGDKAQRIAAEGFRLVDVDMARRSLGPLAGLRAAAAIARTIRRERPDIVHCIALKPIALGALPARLMRVPGLVVAPTGLGLVWTEPGVGPRLVRTLLRSLVGRWLRGPRTRYLFENRDDPHEFGIHPDARDVLIVGGAGVRAQDFAPSPEPAGDDLRVALVARMITPKGIAEAVEAVGKARAQGGAVTLDLYGEPDLENRRSIPLETLRAWSARPGIAWHGRSDDIAAVWRDHHVALLLTHREGLPRTLVEAAAAGRPAVASDVPGCREIVRDGREGILVPPQDTNAAAEALLRLARDPHLRARLGAAARARFLAGFTDEAVAAAVAGLYRSLAEPQSPTSHRIR